MMPRTDDRLAFFKKILEKMVDCLFASTKVIWA